MRIIHVHKYFHQRDGAGRYMFALMRRQQEAGHTTVPFAMQHRLNERSPWEKYFVSELATTSAASGFGALRQLERAWWSGEAAKKMRALLKEVHPDVVHVHNLYTHLSPSILRECRRAGVPVVMTVHDYALVSANYALWGGSKPLEHYDLLAIANSRFNKGWLSTLTLELVTRLQRMFRMYDRSIDRYVVPSMFVADMLASVGYAKKKMEILPPFIEPPAEVQHGAGEYVLFVGRLERYKGAETVVAAARALPDVRFVLVGDGDDRSRLAYLARDVKNLEFRGFLQGSALDEAYARASAVVVPSLWYEPFGLVALEAMWRGIPLIVSDRGSLPEIAAHGEAGLVFAAGNEVALAGRIRELLADPSLAEKLAKKGRERAGELADPEAHVARIFGLYKEVRE